MLLLPVYACRVLCRWSSHWQDLPAEGKPQPTGGVGIERLLATPDENYRWEVREESKVQNCEALRLHMTSQRWQGIDWRHVLTLVGQQIGHVVQRRIASCQRWRLAQGLAEQRTCHGSCAR